MRLNNSSASSGLLVAMTAVIISAMGLTYNAYQNDMNRVSDAVLENTKTIAKLDTKISVLVMRIEMTRSTKMAKNGNDDELTPPPE